MTGSHFEFAYPWVLSLCLFAVLFFFDEIKNKNITKIALSSKHIFQNYKKTFRQKFEWLPPVLRLVSLVLIIVACARPHMANEFTEITSEGVDIVLSLDTSGSMKALDMELDGLQANRMTVVKKVVEDFVQGRDYDRIGMVVFGERAYTQCPLTLDYDILVGYLDLIDIGIAGDGTAIGNALAMSVKRLLDSEAKSKVVILLTDGESNAGEISPEAAAELAEKNDIKVYTIAVGSRDRKVPFPMKNFLGMTKVQYVEMKVDEDTLKMIASKTGGRFFRADSTETLKKIYDRIDQLEKSDVDIERFTFYNELYQKPLFAGLLIYALGWFLKNIIFFRVP